jgi:hypothetical protein
MPSRRRKEGSGGVCIDLHNVRQYMHLMCFYKANIAAVLAAGYQLTEVGNLEELEKFVERYNAWVKKLERRGPLSKKKEEGKEGEEPYLLAPEHFQTCDVPLTSKLDCLVEARENMRNFALPFKELKGMLRTLPAFSRMIDLADATLKVKAGKERKDHIFAVIDGLDALGTSQTMAINREFHAATRGRVLGPTQLYVLTASLLALHNAADARAKLVMQKGKAFTSIAVDGGALPRRYAMFYVDLVRANSEYAEAVASALLAYMNVRDPGRLYEVVRGMTYALERGRLRGQEAEALMRLLEHEARVKEGR